jgi:hypothetical protein
MKKYILFLIVIFALGFLASILSDLLPELAPIVERSGYMLIGAFILTVIQDFSKKKTK